MEGRPRARGTVTAQAPGVLSGNRAARAVAVACGLRVVRALPDGRSVRPGTVVLVVEGPATSVLAAERTILNFLMHLSGVATATSAAVRAARPLRVFATRKTLPGLRSLEKAAVVDGGGEPHRSDLADGVLLKNNHLALVPLETAIARLRKAEGRTARIEAEVRTEAEAVRAARAGAGALLIDNASPARARRIVRRLESEGLRRGRFVELSGGITVATLPRYRQTGADAVSLGALTHSAVAVPFHLTLRRRGNRADAR